MVLGKTESLFLASSRRTLWLRKEVPQNSDPWVHLLFFLLLESQDRGDLHALITIPYKVPSHMLPHLVLMITLWGGQDRYHYAHLQVRKLSPKEPCNLPKKSQIISGQVRTRKQILFLVITVFLREQSRLLSPELPAVQFVHWFIQSTNICSEYEFWGSKFRSAKQT